MADDAPADAAADQPVFFAVSFAVVAHADLVGERVQDLIRVLQDNGATHTPLNPQTGRADRVTQYTHIISQTSDFPDYFAALEHFVHVVKPSWVEASLQRGKPVNPRQHSPDPCLFLSDVVVTCAGDIPGGDQEAIIGGVLAMGGQYSSAVTKMTTHIVALTMDNAKCELARAKNLRCKIVLPHWFDDCLKLGKKIVEVPYELPDPQILSVRSSGPIAHYASEAIRGATTPVPGDLPTPISLSSSSEARVLDVFRGKKILLSADLNIGTRLQRTIEQLVRAGSGDLVTDIDQADTYVCYYRDGADYVTASRAGKDVGNLAWLYHLITHNAWTSPMRRLLHYPVPRNGIPGFEKYTVSVSNYVGEARVYLESLAKACGAEFTRVMRQDNTHLITAHLQSEKCEAAKEWNIHLANHLWLEESYAKCKEQSLTNPKYMHFPPHTNLGEVVGQTQIDREAVERYFFIQPEEEADRKGLRTNGVVQPSRAKKPEVLSTAAQNDTSQTNVPKHGEDLPVRTTPLTKKGKRGQSDITNQRTPARASKGKENETPSTTGSRSAKNRAMSKLQDLAPDIAQYEKEMKRRGGVIYGGRRVSEPEGAEKEKKSKEMHANKRSLDPEEPDEEDEEDEEASVAKGPSRKTKKARADIQPIVHRLILSGDDRWVDKHKKESDDRNKLRALGIFVTTKPEEATILCAPKIVRTKKFVAALSNAPYVVSTNFLDYCIQKKQIPAPEKYLLNDNDGEKRQGIKLIDTIARAKQNRRQLLKGWQIFVTEGVSAGWETLRDIITANGGSCLLWKGRNTSVSKRTKGKMVDDEGDTEMSSDFGTEEDELERNRENDDGDTLYLISGTNSEDVKLWPKFKDMAKKADMTPRIVKPDWLLFVAMAQYIDYEERWEIREDEVPGLRGSSKG